MIDSLRLLGALSRLSMNQREAFIDHVVLHRTFKEIGATMGVSDSRVSQWVRQASERLQYLRVYEPEREAA